METAQSEMAQKRKRLNQKPTSLFSQEELQRQQEMLFEQVRSSIERKEKKEHRIERVFALGS